MSKRGKTLGVIGGMGPLATARFLELLTLKNPVSRDAEHPEVILLSAPYIPDRTGFLLGQTGDDPVPALNAAAEKLYAMGADYVCITCVTAHCFADRFSFEPISVTDCVRRKCPDFSKTGLLATDGVIRTGLFDGMITPSPEGQRLLMSVIYDRVKRGDIPDISALDPIIAPMAAAGAEQILLGCTELPLLKRADNGIFVDPLEILAERALELCAV